LEEVELYGSVIHVVAQDVARLKTAIRLELQNEAVDSGEMAIIEPSLEDVFIASMKK
jgi:hypothetical protein